jgi:hypothetical protein
LCHTYLFILYISFYIVFFILCISFCIFCLNYIFLFAFYICLCIGIGFGVGIGIAIIFFLLLVSGFFIRLKMRRNVPQVQVDGSGNPRTASAGRFSPYFQPRSYQSFGEFENAPVTELELQSVSTFETPL